MHIGWGLKQVNSPMGPGRERLPDLCIAYGLSLANFSADMRVIPEQLSYFRFRQDEVPSILRPCWQFAVNLSEHTQNPTELLEEAMDTSTHGKVVPGSFSESPINILRFILCYIVDKCPVDRIFCTLSVFFTVLRSCFG